MATTPPPPGRIHTPPTPLHGPKHDTYEPYSPRRSARVQQRQHSELLSPPHLRHKLASNAPIDVVSTPRKAPPKRQKSSQTLSPPPSPKSLSRTPPVARGVARGLEIAHLPPDADQAIYNHTSQDCAHTDEQSSMLPTPRKTPSKQRTIANTNRTLFRSQPPNEILPTPRRQRLRNTLDSPPAPSKVIPVYTDSRERIPEMGDEENNPFLGPRQEQSTRRRRGPRNLEEVEMEEAVQRGEGMIFMFRGRKIFRPYTSEHGDIAAEAPLHNLSSQSTRITKFAGASAQRPLTRSSLQPRRLFAETDGDRHGAAADEEVEEDEAVTDIEEEVVEKAEIEAEKASDAGADEPQITTADSTVVATPSAANEMPQGITTSPTQRKGKDRKKPSPFASWRRSKSSSGSGAGTGSATTAKGLKRAAAEPAEDGQRAASGKRTRSSAVAR